MLCYVILQHVLYKNRVAIVTNAFSQKMTRSFVSGNNRTPIIVPPKRAQQEPRRRC